MKDAVCGFAHSHSAEQTLIRLHIEEISTDRSREIGKTVRDLPTEHTVNCPSDGLTAPLCNQAGCNETPTDTPPAGVGTELHSTATHGV